MNHSTSPTTVTDPVCGMTIDPATAVASSIHAGQTYHFCSRGCATSFDAALAEYVGAAAASVPSPSCCSAARSCC